MIQINRYGFSAIWVEIDLALLEKEQPQDAPLKQLGRFDGYTLAFQKAQDHLRETGRPPFLGTPWTKTRGQHFWTRYFEKTMNEKVPPLAAWQFLTPFRSVLPADTRVAIEPQTPGESIDIQCELFFYPFGVACIITQTISSETPLSLEEMVKRASILRRQPCLTVVWQNDPPPKPFETAQFPTIPDEPITLNHLGDLGVEMARRTAFGPTHEGGKRVAIQPFTIFCVLAGEIENNFPLSSGSDIHKGMHAITSWKDWQNVTAPLDKSRMHLGEGADMEADMLYAVKRGRAIWYPTKFSDYQASSLTALRCYWRNLTFASLQTESLAGFVDAIMNKSNLSSEQDHLRRRAAGILGRLFGGVDATYRSRSLARQIEDNGWMEQINLLRKDLGMEALSE